MERNPIPSFPSRKRIWEKRRNITKEKQIVTGKYYDQDFLKKYETDPEIHPEGGILNVKKTVGECMCRLKICDMCGNTDPAKLTRVPLDRDCYVIWCVDCDNVFGVDDTRSVYEVKDIVDSWKVQLCDCGNNDIHQYTYEQEGEIGRHLLCKK